ncbi:MAG: malto-oligosyltrehalose trehalohydrolase [Polyangia bacterium]
MIPGRGVHFRVWAPERRRVAVVIDPDRSQGQHADARARSIELAREEDGCWSGLGADLLPGARYGFKLDDDERVYPDPASRFQPDGPHGRSEVIDPSAFAWTDAEWPGVTLRGQVIYELHIGTFTPEGTWAAARARLPQLRELGVTLLELMPVADFPGDFGWGYDGVNLFAPTRLYGRPDDLRAFVDAAHGLGLGVILDVVYNHLGPDGNYLRCFAPAYFSERATEWGDAINFDGTSCGPVRDYFAENAAYWIDEFHLDGLRIDATQSLFDDSDEHILAAIARAARRAAGSRSIVLVAENEPQDTRLVRAPHEGGYGLDALWNDDLHHSLTVALTGRNEAYYSDYRGSAQELLSAIKHGTLYQGQRYVWQKQRRGTPSRGLPPETFVAYLENHDQVANSGRGERTWQRASPGCKRAATALLLLAPWTPMLFQGEEWDSSRPFLYFAHHHPELAALVRKGRGEFLSQFPSCATPELQARLADPAARDTFTGCRLDWDERERPHHARTLRLYRDLITLRRTDPIVAAQATGEVGRDGAVLSPACFVLRLFGPHADDRLLLVNLGRDLPLCPAPEPLLAPPEGQRWRILLSTEHPDYGGAGTPDPETEADGWRVPGHAALLLAPVPSSPTEKRA